MIIFVAVPLFKSHTIKIWNENPWQYYEVIFLVSIFWHSTLQINCVYCRTYKKLLQWYTWGDWYLKTDPVRSVNLVNTHSSITCWKMTWSLLQQLFDGPFIWLLTNALFSSVKHLQCKIYLTENINSYCTLRSSLCFFSWCLRWAVWGRSLCVWVSGWPYGLTLKSKRTQNFIFIIDINIFTYPTFYSGVRSQV